MLVSRLEKNYGYDVPIFTEDIFECMNDYSRQRIYQLIKEALEKGILVRFDTGVYYLPTKTEFGFSTISVDEVVYKKYISNNNEIFGIYGKDIIDLNFLLSYQVPNSIEVITNKESRDVREIEIKGRRVILRKSRLEITKNNVKTYIFMELFNNINLRKYKEDLMAQDSVKKYIKKNKITNKKIYELAKFFPAKTMKNLAVSGVLYEIA